MGGQLGAMGDNASMVGRLCYDRMMQDKKFVEDSYHRISADKLFTMPIEGEVTTKDEDITAEKLSLIC
jgi:trigger factor